jgi:outer membrane protein OmpA-like peptidoglycan-associated protein
MIKKIIFGFSLLFLGSCSSNVFKVCSSEDAPDFVAKETVEIGGGLNGNVFFAHDSAVISSQLVEILKRDVISKIKKSENSRIKIDAHSDEKGEDIYNLDLSKRRGEAVKDYLVENGVDASRIKVHSFGESQPLDLGHSEDALSKNRRVLISFE